MGRGYDVSPISPSASRFVSSPVPFFHIAEVATPCVIESYIMCYDLVLIETLENQKFSCAITRDAWQNFRIWSFVSWWGDLIGNGWATYKTTRAVEHCATSFEGLEPPLEISFWSDNVSVQVAVEGNIGSGKSTFLNFFQQFPIVHVSKQLSIF